MRILMASVSLIAAGALANNFPETDLTPANETESIFALTDGTNLQPGGQETKAQEGFRLELVRKVKKDLVGVPGLVLKLSTGHEIQLDKNGVYQSDVFCTGNVSATATFETPYFVVGQGSWNSTNNYSLAFTIPCSGATQVWSEPGTPTSQVLTIWTIAYTAQEKMRAAVGLEFWKHKITFNFPGDGAYYSAGVVNIPNGDQWDVVGHELGHAIYDQGGIGQLEGGQHYIDRCYDETLALSEGWASYFSAFLSVDLKDPDAKFEYMVPRRAPIRFENIPADVCNGYTNEWRVTGFLWDLIDLHDDGEKFTETFANVWNLTKDKNASSLQNIRDSLAAGGLRADDLDALWKMDAGGTSMIPAEFRSYPTFELFDDFLRSHN